MQLDHYQTPVCNASPLKNAKKGGGGYTLLTQSVGRISASVIRQAKPYLVGLRCANPSYTLYQTSVCNAENRRGFRREPQKFSFLRAIQFPLKNAKKGGGGYTLLTQSVGRISASVIRQAKPYLVGLRCANPSYTLYQTSVCNAENRRGFRREPQRFSFLRAIQSPLKNANGFTLIIELTVLKSKTASSLKKGGDGYTFLTQSVGRISASVIRQTKPHLIGLPCANPINKNNYFLLIPKQRTL